MRAHLLKRVLSIALALALLLSLTPVVSFAVEDDNTGYVHVYAPTGDDPTTTENESPDVESVKYQVKANNTSVPAIQYIAKGHNMDIARFASEDRTPKFEITLINSETINSVQVYPERYYPAEALTVSSDKKTLTFTLSDKLPYAIVYINGSALNQKGSPYLTLINDPLENEAAKPKLSDPNVLNFKEFSANYLAEHPITDTVGEICREAGVVQDYSNNDSTLYTLHYDAGKFVDYNSSVVCFPNKRARQSNDLSDALQAALETIKNSNVLDTLYIPSGTYLWSGLRIIGWNGDTEKGGKPLTIYTEEGALLQNRLSECRESIEPAILVSESSYVTISGRGIYDGQGCINTDKDKKDARNTPHQGGSMSFYSNHITFNDTYMRDAKQWNWECHTVENINYNNIKGLTPYNHAWIDGLDLTSGKNVYVNGAITLGNDDCFASGHYNPSDEFPRRSISENNFTETIGAAAYFYNKNRLNWDTADSENICVTNTINWTLNIANGIRTGHNTWGHKLLSYTFDNFNPVNYAGTGIRIQNNNNNSFPGYESIIVRNSNFTCSGSGDWALVPTNTKNLIIPTVTIDNCWFTNRNIKATFQSITDLVINNLYIGGELVKYRNQATLNTSGLTNFTFTADGKEVEDNSPPVFTLASDEYSAFSNNLLSFVVAATDPDKEDTVTLEAVPSTLPAGASFDAVTGKFNWKPSEADADKTFTVTFNAYDDAARTGDCQPTSVNVRIAVLASGQTTTLYYVQEDTTLSTWKTDKTTNYSRDKYLTMRLINSSSGLLGEKYSNTSTSATDDGKISLLRFNLDGIKASPAFSKAELVLTYLGKRNTSGDVNDTIRVAVANDDWTANRVTFNTKPSITADGDGAVKESASFRLGSKNIDKTKPYQDIDGRKITVDITDFVRSAIENEETNLCLAINESGSNEIYFASLDGSTDQRNQSIAPAIKLTVPMDGVEISGPSELTLNEKYEETLSDRFTILGKAPISVSIKSGNRKISWVEDTYQLKIAEGLAPGEYPVVLEAKNADNETAEYTFTLTVVEVIRGIEKNIYTSGDTYVASWNAAQQAFNYGDNEYMRASLMTNANSNASLGRMGENYTGSGGSGNDGKIAFLKFDLGENKNNLLSATLTLTLHGRSRSNYTGNDTIRVVAVPSGWIEGNGSSRTNVNSTIENSLTWANMPDFDTTEAIVKESAPFKVDSKGAITLDASYSTSHSVDGTRVTVDVLDLINQMDEDETELCLAFCDTRNFDLAFVSKEGAVRNRNANESMQPTLNLLIKENVITGILEYLIEYAETLKAEGGLENTLPVVIELFEDALESAKFVLAHVTPSQEDIDEATDALFEMITLADWKVADKSVLEEVIAEAEALDLDEYISTGKEELAEAIEAAKEVLEDENAIQEDADAAVEAILEAIENLIKKADKTLLQKAIELADKLDLSNYVEAGKPEFEAAYRAAQAVMENEDALQAEVDEAYEELMETMSALRLKVNKDKLAELLAKAQAKDEVSEELEEAMVMASILLGDEELDEDDQDTVDGAAANLEAALEDGENTEEPGTSEEPGDEPSDEPDDDAPVNTGSAAPYAMMAMLAVSAAGIFLLKKRNGRDA